MEDFKKKLENRQRILSAGVLFSCGITLLLNGFFGGASASEHLGEFIHGFRLGLAVALIGILLFFLCKNRAAMGDEGQLKKLYISETDERMRLIQQKSDSMGMHVIVYSLVMGAVIAGSIHEMVFFTLLGTCLFVSIGRGTLKLYYCKKY